MSEPEFSFTSRARPVCEIGVGDTRVDTGVGRWDVARWDAVDATWAGSQPLWLDRSCEMVEASTFYGRPRSSDRFSVGTAELSALNADGWADPISQESLLRLRPGRQVRVGIDHAVYGRRWLWRGYIDACTPRYDPTLGDVVDIEAICALGEAGRNELAELAAPIGSGELAGTRINRILNARRWPAGYRQIEQTGVAMLPTTLGQQTADLLAVVTDSVGGSLYGDLEGRLVFRGRDWQMYEPSDPIDGTIGNTAGDVCPSVWWLSDRRADVVTQVQLARETDVEPFEWNDPKGQQLYGIETYSANDLVCETTQQLSRLANRLLRTRGYSRQPRVERALLVAATSSAALDLMTTVDVFAPSRYRCRHRESRGVIFDREMFATGVAHYITRDRWELDLDLDDAAPWRAVAGRWDQAFWDLDLWSGLAARDTKELAA